MSLNNSNALNLVGKEVNIKDGMIEHDEGEEHQINYTIPEGAETITIEVQDEEGRVIYAQDLDGTVPGETEFTWLGFNDDQGAAGEGAYTISATAKDADGNSIDLGIYQRRKIDGLAYENGQILLIIGDRKLPIDGINEVYDGSAFSSGESSTNFKSNFQPSYSANYSAGFPADYAAMAYRRT